MQRGQSVLAPCCAAPSPKTIGPAPDALPFSLQGHWGLQPRKNRPSAVRLQADSMATAAAQTRLQEAEPAAATQGAEGLSWAQANPGKSRCGGAAGGGNNRHSAFRFPPASAGCWLHACQAFNPVHLLTCSQSWQTLQPAALAWLQASSSLPTHSALHSPLLPALRSACDPAPDGAAGVVLTNWVDVIKVRQQLAGSEARNLAATGWQVVRHEGPLALCKGITPAVARGVLYGGGPCDGDTTASGVAQSKALPQAGGKAAAHPDHAPAPQPPARSRRPAHRAVFAPEGPARGGEPGQQRDCVQGGSRHAERRAGGRHLQPHRSGQDADAEGRRRARRALCRAGAGGAH